MAGPVEDLPIETPSVSAEAAAEAAPISTASDVPPVVAEPPGVTTEATAEVAPDTEVVASETPTEPEPTLLDKFDADKKAEAEPKPEDAPAEVEAKPEEKPEAKPEAKPEVAPAPAAEADGNAEAAE